MQVLISLNIEGHLLLGRRGPLVLINSFRDALHGTPEALFGLIVVLRGNIINELLNPRRVLDLLF